MIFKFLNHASFLTTTNGVTLITDPWFVSNAFGSWYQRPFPIAKEIFDLIDNPKKEKFGVIVSHGHDDHCDDWFISKHLKEHIFFCPKFSKPSIDLRLKKQLGVKTKIIGEGIKFGDFFIRQFINPNFTHYDAIITIETKDFIIIHANDNWHEWPTIIKKGLQALVEKFNGKQVYLLVQFGIADCFPVNYPKLKESEQRKIIFSRFKSYFNASQRNMKNLGVSKVYFYANQSDFHYHSEYFSSMYDEAQKFLMKKNKTYVQLLPGMVILDQDRIYQNKGNDIFEYRKHALENYINDKFLSLVGKTNFIKTKIITELNKAENNFINYQADVSVWNRIFNGDLNLESIIIGGAGKIISPNKNISEHHHFISKQSYVIQNQIKQKGLLFFREHYGKAI